MDLRPEGERAMENMKANEVYLLSIYGEKKHFCRAEKVYLPGNLLVNINKHIYRLKWTHTSCFNCMWNAVLFLCVTSCFICFVFYVPLQIYAGMNHVIASQFIVKEPNHLNSKTAVPWELEGIWNRLNWGNKSFLSLRYSVVFELVLLDRNVT